MVEEWKDILGYEGIYQVSNLGNIKSLYRTKLMYNGRIAPVYEKILGTTKTQGRYKSVTLCKDNTRRTVTVHRLVACAFLYNDTSTDVINHKDGNTLNNNVTNLEYCTQSHNVSHSYILGNAIQLGSKNANSSLTENDVIQIRNLLKSYTCKEIATQYNVSYYTISDIKRNRTWKHV